LGDLVMSTPGFRALRAGFPDARIALQVRASLAPTLAGSPWFDEILPLRSYHAGSGALLREARSLRRADYELGICIPESWSSALLLRAAGITHRVGYGGRGRGLLLTRAVAVPNEWGRRRLVARERFVLGLVDALGLEASDTRVELFTTPEEESAADTLLEAHGLRRGESLVALAPGASYGSSKLWPAESFARVADAALAVGARPLVLGSADERPLASRVVAEMRGQGVDLAGRMDLGVMKAVLRRCRALVCNDAGARHVAVALGVPCVVMMGPTSLEKTSLNLERVRVLETDVECRPCYHRVCPIDHRCMTRLSPDAATRAMLDLLKAESLAQDSPGSEREREEEVGVGE
jgi:heptosyltransferase-2